MKTKEKQLLIKTAAVNTIEHLNKILPELYAEKWDLESKLRDVKRKIHETTTRVQEIGQDPFSIVSEQYELSAGFKAEEKKE